mgnify:CR=1 FL=1
MNEWGVVGVLVVLVPFGISIIKPIVSLTKSIAELTTIVSQLKEDIKNQRNQAKESHQKLWDYNGEQDDRINELEKDVAALKATE